MGSGAISAVEFTVFAPSSELCVFWKECVWCKQRLQATFAPSVCSTGSSPLLHRMQPALIFGDSTDQVGRIASTPTGLAWLVTYALLFLHSLLEQLRARMGRVPARGSYA